MQTFESAKPSIWAVLFPGSVTVLGAWTNLLKCCIGTVSLSWASVVLSLSFRRDSQLIREMRILKNNKIIIDSADPCLTRVLKNYLDQNIPPNPVFPQNRCRRSLVSLTCFTLVKLMEFIYLFLYSWTLCTVISFMPGQNPKRRLFPQAPAVLFPTGDSWKSCALLW